MFSLGWMHACASKDKPDDDFTPGVSEPAADGEAPTRVEVASRAGGSIGDMRRDLAAGLFDGSLLGACGRVDRMDVDKAAASRSSPV
jgi:hypothetical protein